MSFWKKLATYLMGVGLGVVLVYFIFGDRDIQCNYFPNDRVLYDLGKKELKVSEDVSSTLSGGHSADSVIQWTLERGKIDFEQSNARQEPCAVYYITLEEPSYQVAIENCDSVATVLSLRSH